MGQIEIQHSHDHFNHLLQAPRGAFVVVVRPLSLLIYLISFCTVASLSVVAAKTNHVPYLVCMTRNFFLLSNANFFAHYKINNNTIFYQQKFNLIY